MTVIVDTGVLYAEHDTDATRYETTSRALEAVYDGEFGHPYINDYIFDEVITLTRNRTSSFAATKKLGDRLRGVDPYPTPVPSLPYLLPPRDVHEFFSESLELGWQLVFAHIPCMVVLQPCSPKGPMPSSEDSLVGTSSVRAIPVHFSCRG